MQENTIFKGNANLTSLKTIHFGLKDETSFPKFYFRKKIVAFIGKLANGFQDLQWVTLKSMWS
jgi:hypothetical protein